MKKKIILSTSVMVITAGSIFAFSAGDQRAAEQTLTDPCAVKCCAPGEEQNTNPPCCETEGTNCCSKL